HPFSHDRIVAGATIRLVAVDMHGALLMQAMGCDVGKTAGAGQRWKDVTVAVNNAEIHESSLLHSWVEFVAQAIAEGIERKYQRRNGKTRRDHEMRRNLEHLAARAKHCTP